MLKRKPAEAPTSPGAQLRLEEAGQEEEEEEEDELEEEVILEQDDEPEQEDESEQEDEPEQEDEHEQGDEAEGERDSEQEEVELGTDHGRTEPEGAENDEEVIQNSLMADWADEEEEDGADLDDIDLAIKPAPWENGDAYEELDENENEEDRPEDENDQSMSQYEPETDANDDDLPDQNLAIVRRVADNAMAMSGDQHSHSEPYKVPASPDLAVQDQRREPVAYHGDDTTGQPRKHTKTAQARPAGEVEEADNQREEHANVEDEDIGIDSDVDFEVESELGLEYGNLSLQELLAHDVERFRSRRSRGDAFQDDSLLFGPPEGPSSTTIHLSSENVEKLRKTIQKNGWVGRAKDAQGRKLDWEEKLLRDRNCPESVTAVGKVLIHFGCKVDRLIQLISRIPSPEMRNRVFGEHVDFLHYCFSMIEDCIAFVRDQRLAFSRKQMPLSESKEKREEMVEEIAALHVPTIFQLLTRIWAPYSKDERRSSFDSFIVSLLARVVGWIEQLYRPFIRDVRAAGSSTPWMRVREEFEIPLQHLREQLAQAPELLEEKEKLEALEEARRQRQLELQREKRLRMQHEEERRLETRRRQNEDVARLLNYEAGRRPEARRRQNHDAASFTRQQHPIRTRDASQQVQSSPAATGIKETIWRGEEERVLCEKLISSFVFEVPRLPNLRETATLIGHTRDETVDKARELLHSIISCGGKGLLSEEEVQNRVQSIVRQWE
ncbi:hypothetical protein PG995_016305 [Apiospora arundinis]